MSPLRNDGLSPAKEVIGKRYDTLPTETQKVVPLKSNCTGGKALVVKPTFGSPIQDKQNAGADVLKKHSGQGIFLNSSFRLISLLCNLLYEIFLILFRSRNVPPSQWRSYIRQDRNEIRQ